MPVFHFNAQGERDEQGTDLADLRTAKCEAITLAGRLICEDADRFWVEAEWEMTVTDDKGLTLFQLQIVGTDAPVTSASARDARPFPRGRA